MPADECQPTLCLFLEELLRRAKESNAPSETVHLPEESASYDERIVVVVMACNRVSITRALDRIFTYLPATNFPVILSQDCGDRQTADVIEGYENKLLHILVRTLCAACYCF